MRKNRFRRTAVIITYLSIIALFVPGCTSNRNMLNYQKFRYLKEPSGEAVQKNVVADPSPARIKAMKGNPESHYLLGLHYQQRGRHKEAIEEFRKTVTIDPDYFKAYNAMGVSYDNIREFERAGDAYRMALKLAPNEDYIYNNFGYSLVLKGDYASAEEMLKKGIEINTSNGQLHNNLAVAYAGEDKYDLALEELNRTNNPAGALFSLAQILQQRGRAEQADTFFAAAASLAPSFKHKLQEKDPFAARVSNSLRQTDGVKTEDIIETTGNVKNNTVKKTSVSKQMADAGKLQRKTENNIDLKYNLLMINLTRQAKKHIGKKVYNKTGQPVSGLMKTLFPASSNRINTSPELKGAAQWF